MKISHIAMDLKAIYTVIPYKDQLIKMSQPKQAWAYYSNHKIDLLSGQKIESAIGLWIEQLHKRSIAEKSRVLRLTHFFYELGFLYHQPHLLTSDCLLAIEIEYSHYQSIELSRGRKLDLLLQNAPKVSDYHQAFKNGYNELLKGNCYQFNLTYPFIYEFGRDIDANDFISALWLTKENRGAYSSATMIPFFQKLYFSNSPECLFQFDSGVLATMPIKGTIKRNDDDDWKALWKKLVRDKKNQAELYMICDLLRNDLSAIEHPVSKVVFKKMPLLVPSLLHQCSRVEVELSSKISVGRVMEKIFPGGSITGAPKKRVIDILANLEQRHRGFYCGSTLIEWRQMKAASINIRACEVNFKNRTLIYQAGGGITLRSAEQEEYLEMTYKLGSFINSLTL